MRALARWSASTLAFAITGWIALVLVAWLFTPGGQAVITFIQIAMQEEGPFAIELPLASMRFWAVTAGLVAVLPALFLIATWTRARRAASKAAA